MKLSKILISGLLFLFLCATSAWAVQPDVAGSWKVTTKLVTSQDSTNPNYHVGDKRIEKWSVSASSKKANLRTPAGKIAGKKVGKAWVFQQTYDTGYGILVNMYIVARTLSRAKMQGTIKTTYLSAQFGYPVGIDAWSFTGARR